jgi:hypothetical protein
MSAWRIAAATAAVCLCITATAETIEETFDDAARWNPIEGDWRVEDGAYVQSDASSPAYRYSIFDTALREGTIEATATPLERNYNGNVGASLGLMVKYLADDRWCAARFGSYGVLSLLIRDAGDKGRISLGHFRPEPGRSYRVRVLVRNGMLAIVREGLVVAILSDPFADEAGRPGLFTETRCRFDDFSIEVAEE